jgi:NADH:ubiquinone oxidoreductase subunit F (NADH-binding)
MTARTVRLLPADDTGSRLLDLRSLEAHVRHYGAMPLVAVASAGKPGSLVDELHTAGLRGRGGGWFPTSRKFHAVVESAAARRALSGGRKTVVIANAMEGEPASSKDAVLLSHSPHLVLDGIQAAARTIGATNAYIAVHRGSPLIATIDAALAERGSLDTVPVELITPPARYVASEESALAHWAGDGVATPVYGERPFQSGMNGRPTLVQNAETLAHIALIARHGGAWFASVGNPAAPGTTLVSVGGAVAMPGVIEVATGTPVREILQRCGGESATVQGFLTGGYGGAWVKTDELIDTPWAPDAVANTGGVIGAGILWAFDDQHCGIRELEAVARWMAGESAGQCGPCRFGLPAVADDLALLLTAQADHEALSELNQRLPLIQGRGGCKHPDGTARFISSGLHAFHEELAHHLHGRCTARITESALPIPASRAIPVRKGGKDFT